MPSLRFPCHLPFASSSLELELDGTRAAEACAPAGSAGPLCIASYFTVGLAGITEESSTTLPQSYASAILPCILSDRGAGQNAAAPGRCAPFMARGRAVYAH
jgi:hypothetical protein